MRPRIGLYGGCFNPVHEGHMVAARGALAVLGLDEVIFIPSGSPPLKGAEGLAPGTHRLAMLAAAVADDARLSVSAIEIDRAGPSFTVDTVRELRAASTDGAEFFFLLGDDCVDRLPHWKGVAELHVMLRFAIVPRVGGVWTDDRLIRLDLPKMAASSTQIRAMLYAGQTPPPALLPAAVMKYIAQHKIYAVPAARACA